MSVSASPSLKITVNNAPTQNYFSVKTIKRELQKTVRYAGKIATIAGKADGWDEAAVAGSNILPAYLRPAFLTVAMLACVKPVSLGAQAMAAEFQEMKDDVQQLKNKQVDLALKLLASEHTPKDIKEKLITEFEGYNKHNEWHLGDLNEVSDKSRATEIKKAFKKLDIKFDASDDVIEGLLKKDNPNADNYKNLKQARDFITQYQEADREGKTGLTEAIDTFVSKNKGELKIKDTDTLIQKLQKIADSILEARRDEYIIKLFTDYHGDLKYKSFLKEILDLKERSNDANFLDKGKKLLTRMYPEQEKAINNINDINTVKSELDKAQEYIFRALYKTPLMNADQANSAILEYKRNAKEITIEKTPVTSYLGNAAMFGMTLGTGLSAAKAGSQLLGQFGVLPNLMPALTAGLELATSRTFMASQVAMVGYGLGQAYKGYVKNNLIAKDKEALESSKDLTETQKEDQLKHIEQLQNYNMRKNTVYGLGTAAAEAGMIAGSLTGSTPLLMASALGTLAFAGLRMWTQSAEAKLTGHDHDHEHNGKPVGLFFNPVKKPEVEVPYHIHTASCNHNITFELNHQEVTKNYDDNIKGLQELNDIIDNNFTFTNLINAKSLSCSSQENHQIIFYGFVTQNSSKTFNEKKVQNDYINSIITNPTALEEAKEILIDALNDNEDSNKDIKNEVLQIFKDRIIDKEKLKELLTDNLELLDKPQNAKRILKPLLEERIEKLTAKKHNLIQNMVHLTVVNKT